ncbi:MAG: hypothetical protein P8J45_12215 [Phycisphaerales bacterium]|jgi:hypothetical protein|nr:hypothetical protein [Phycisphaerales bacterium]
MKRGNKVTLYELMHQASETNDAKSSVRSESTARVIRLPIGFLYTGLVVVLLLLIALYAYGFHRGQVATEAKWAQDTIDSAEADRLLGQTNEVTEPTKPDEVPGIASAPVTTTGNPSGTAVAGTTIPVTTKPTKPTSTDPRRSGLNYYIICHPSRAKLDELVAFCSQHGLDAHSSPNRKGDPKVYVTPGFASGESSAAPMVALRARIREVGVLWNRLDPGQNSDFSTHYPEKYQP